MEADASDIPPGGSKTAEWRGKPVWVVGRTPAMPAALQGHDADLADPQSARNQQPDNARNVLPSIRPEIVVAEGICTHPGCWPSNPPAGAANPSLPADWPGGFFCPCHGSTFGGAGRVFKNRPAPTQLDVPPRPRWTPPCAAASGRPWPSGALPCRCCSGISTTSSAA